MKRKICIFGAGSFGIKVLKSIKKNKFEVKCFLDNDVLKIGKFIEGIEVLCIDKLKELDIDLVLIASQYCNEIEEQLIGLGIDKDTMINMFYHNNINKKINEFENSINSLEDKLSYVLEEKNRDEFLIETSLCNMKNLGRNRKINFMKCKDYITYPVDFVRISSLELVCDEIARKNIKGSVAELGVYRGDFASAINKLFGDRKLFLFDTFEGFKESDVSFDEKNNYLLNENIKEGHFRNTGLDIVLNKMENKRNCIIKKGYFPNTTLGLEDEEYCFVSIDVDLYVPTYEGLKYFYPRISKGGYIFVHDYNNKFYKGVKEAVNRFCDEEKISYFQMSDFNGSIVICK